MPATTNTWPSCSRGRKRATSYGEDKAVNVPPGARVEDVQFSPTDDQLAFVARAEFQPGSGSHQKSGELYRYDAGDGRLRTVHIPGGEGGVESVLYSRDGQVLPLPDGGRDVLPDWRDAGDET